MHGRKGWWPWAVAGTAAAALVTLLVATVLPLDGHGGLETSANITQLTALLIAAGTAAVGVVM